MQLNGQELCFNFQMTFARGWRSAEFECRVKVAGGGEVHALMQLV